MTLRDLLQQRVVELDKEINRTDSLAFKQELQQLDRTIERIVGVLSVGLDRSRAVTSSGSNRERPPGAHEGH